MSKVNTMQSIRNTLIIVTLFSIAMGFMESAVVIYLRALYYPHGFTFPMVPTSDTVFRTEILRELATIIMLACIGIISGKRLTERFAFFIFSFAIWDICYYLFLKWLIDWPESLLTWDILFLIPLPWYGPVLAPCLISLTMMVLAILILSAEQKNSKVKIMKPDWIWMIVASIVFIASFTIEFIKWFIKGGHALNTMGFEFIPNSYNWWLFLTGELVLIKVIIGLYRRYFVNTKG